MNQKNLPIFQKVSDLLKTPVFMAKLRKPVIPRLVFLKKSRKMKRFRLLKHHNHQLMEEYEFSPSSSPLLSFKRKDSHLQIKRRRRDVHAMVVFFGRCFGGGGLRGRRRRREAELCSLAMEIVPRSGDVAGKILQPLDSVDGGDEEDSIDQRAERFIQRFYQDMRLQRQESY